MLQEQGKVDPVVTQGAGDGSTLADPSPPNKKRKCDDDEDDNDKQHPPLPEQKKQKKPRKKAKKSSSKKKTAPGPAKSETHEGNFIGEPMGTAKVNPHRARILIGKQALAAIKEGTRE